MASYNRYQYETSPRKLEPEYRPVKKRYPKKSTAKKKQDKKAAPKKQTTVRKEAQNTKMHVVMCVVFAFAILFAISYRNSQIGEEFSQIKTMKTELASLEKENEQLKANIESSLNLSNIERTASENLGMTKLDNGRTVYINMHKQDYVQSGSEEVIKKDNDTWFQKIINWVIGYIK